MKKIKVGLINTILVIVFWFGVAILVWGFSFILMKSEDRSAGASLMQAGAAIMTFVIMIMMPLHTAAKAETARANAVIRRILRESGAFFFAFDKAEKFLSRVSGNSVRPVTIESHLYSALAAFEAPRNWTYFQDSFTRLANENIDNTIAASLVACLYEASSRLNAAYQGLSWDNGVRVEEISSFYFGYRDSVETVYEAKRYYEALKEAHPNLLPLELTTVKLTG